MAVLLETSVGDLVIDLKVDDAPTTCENFLKLCKIKYYNNCLFHTVQKDFIAIAGDPTNTGKGGQSVYAKLPSGKKFFRDEIHQKNKHSVLGTVAMANDQPNENGSQFYITLREKVEQLDGKHTIFGTLAEGAEVLAKINAALVDEKDAPYQNIRIWHTEILDDPVPDPDGLQALIPPKSPEPIRDEEFKKIEGEADEAALQERMATTLAKSQATTLELLHDLPDADIKPPDNDLFIAKLNPITQDGDLELIFSRFGPIKSCEIVRDWKTGDSLQYAFITFENVADCERAYFKMHDCVIDDRRIFVNFSQSVAKLWNRWRTGASTKVSAEDLQGSKGKGKGKGKGGGEKGKGKGKPDREEPAPARQGGRGEEDRRGLGQPRRDEGRREEGRRGQEESRRQESRRELPRGDRSRSREPRRADRRGRSPPDRRREDDRQKDRKHGR